MSWLDHASDTVMVAEDKGETDALLSSKVKEQTRADKRVSQPRNR